MGVSMVHIGAPESRAVTMMAFSLSTGAGAGSCAASGAAARAAMKAARGTTRVIMAGLGGRSGRDRHPAMNPGKTGAFPG